MSANGKSIPILGAHPVTDAEKIVNDFVRQKDDIDHIASVVFMKNGQVKVMMTDQNVMLVSYAAGILQDVALGPYRQEQAMRAHQQAMVNQAAAGIGQKNMRGN